ncbi:MAG: hypothetical protein KAQ79_00790, partial [Cyclobacteriaceae bacterium]|nr:hypothetical protein [Cyclobacteriaceae bacterium]
LFNPLESVWALSEGYFTSAAGDVWPDKAIEINDAYSEAMDVMTKSWLDYLIGDNHYLDKAEVVESDEGKVQLKVANHNFSVLVLPPMFILSQSTSAKILEFAKAGGSVVILGDLPIGSPQIGLDDPLIKDRMQELVSFPSVINLSDKEGKMDLLPEKIKEVIEPQIEMTKGDLPLLVSHRTIENKDLYWLANNSGIKQSLTLSLRDGIGASEMWDCETGKIDPCSYRRVSNRNQIELEFDPYEAFWLVFDPSKEPVSEEKSQAIDLIEIELSEPWKIHYPETHNIKLTSARSFIVGDTTTHHEFLNPDYDDYEWNYLNIVGDIRLEAAWNCSMFYNPEPDSKRYYRYKFNLADNPKGAVVNLNADNKITFWVNGKEIDRGKNAESGSAFDTHDINYLLRIGENLIAVEETNGLGHGWMVFQGHAQLDNGKEIEILSNSDWKEASIVSPNWQTIEFDDSLWQSPLLAKENISTFYFLRMRPPNKIKNPKSTVWWRIDVVPNAQYLLLPGLSDNAEIWVDGNKVTIDNTKLVLPE